MLAPDLVATEPASCLVLDVLDIASEKEFDALVKVASLVCGVPIALVTLVDEQRWPAQGRAPVRIPSDCTFAACAIAVDGLFVVADASLDACFQHDPLVTAPPHIRFYAGLAIILDDGSRVGTLCVVDVVPRQLDVGQCMILESLAVAAARIMEGRRAVRDQQVLAAELSLHRALLDRTGTLAGVGGWEVDLLRNTVYWSDETCRIHGVPPGYVPDMAQAIAFYPPEARPLIEAAMASSMLTGEHWDMELPFVRRDGACLWVRAFGSAEFTDGKAVRIVGAFQDITGRKAVEHALRDSQLFIEGILDSVDNQIAVLDSMGDIIATNVAWRKFGAENGACSLDVIDHIGTNYLLLCDDAPGTLDKPLSVRQGIVAILEGRLAHFQCEYPCDAPGVERWFSMAVTPLLVGGRGAVVVHTDITLSKQAEQLMRNFAYYDSLTLLANRRLLQEKLAMLMAKNRRSGLLGALMVLDLDNFKPLNDLHGHAVGDLLLQEVARRLMAGIREVDMVARLGGDEFVVVLGELDGARVGAGRQAMLIADNIRLSLARPYRFGGATDGPGIEHHCSSSIGVVLFSGNEASQTEIFTLADVAMYRAKASGRNRARLSTP